MKRHWLVASTEDKALSLMLGSFFLGMAVSLLTLLGPAVPFWVRLLEGVSFVLVGAAGFYLAKFDSFGEDEASQDEGEL